MTNLRNLKITIAVAAFAILSVIVLSAWDFKNEPEFWRDHYQQTGNDTIPKKEARDKKIQDFDDVLEELNAAELKLDMEKMKKELDEAMKQIDLQKMQFDIQKAMHEVDLEKMKKELDESLSKIDFSKMQADMEKALKEFDAVKLQKEIQMSMEKINWDKMKEDLDRVKEIDTKKMQMDMEKMEKELSKIGPEIEKSLENAKKDLEKAKAEMKEYKNFVDGLESDGLINKKSPYTIKHKDGELIINGKKANDSTYNKYKSFLEKHKTFSIEKSGDDFNIDID